MQSRRHSIYENIAGAALRLIISMLAVAYLLPLCGINLPLNENIEATVILVAINGVVTYVNRRAFNAHLRRAG